MITETEKKGKRISFLFSPEVPKNGTYGVEKADSSGRKRRYLEGVSSGIQIDGHGERMTSRAIQSFQRQAASGDLMLYKGKHGIDFSMDIGILDDSKILDNNDWWTSYRLYDEFDTNIGQGNIEAAKTCWAQIQGLPPYTTAKPRGFSIEGVVPEESILSKQIDSNGNYTNRVIDDVVLEGVVLVGVPAYKASIATAIYKALGELPPESRDRIGKTVSNVIKQQIMSDENLNRYYTTRCKIEDAFEKQISKVLSISDGREAERLNIVFKAYSDEMINLILNNADTFREHLPSRAKDAPDNSDQSPLARSLRGVIEMLKEKTVGGKKS